LATEADDLKEREARRAAGFARRETQSGLFAASPSFKRPAGSGTRPKGAGEYALAPRHLEAEQKLSSAFFASRGAALRLS
jgi:hypothetical protein